MKQWKVDTVKAVAKLQQEHGKALRGVDVAEELGLSKSAAARRLRILRKDGLVTFDSSKSTTLLLNERVGILHENGDAVPVKVVRVYG